MKQVSSSASNSLSEATFTTGIEEYGKGSLQIPMLCCVSYPNMYLYPSPGN